MSFVVHAISTTKDTKVHEGRRSELQLPPKDLDPTDLSFGTTNQPAGIFVRSDVNVLAGCVVVNSQILVQMGDYLTGRH